MSGPFWSKRAIKANQPPDGQSWVWMTRELLESEAMRGLSISAHRALARVMIEHMSHAGRENGRLKVTSRDFRNFGVNWRSITDAIAELEAAGLIHVTFRGRKAHGADRGAPAEYALSWLPIVTKDNIEPPTNAWRYPKAKPAPKPKGKPKVGAECDNIVPFARLQSKKEGR